MIEICFEDKTRLHYAVFSCKFPYFRPLNNYNL